MNLALEATRSQIIDSDIDLKGVSLVSEGKSVAPAVTSVENVSQCVFCCKFRVP